MTATHRRWFRLAPIVFVLAWAAAVHGLRRPDAGPGARGSRVRAGVERALR